MPKIPVHTLPLTFERPVRPVYDKYSGKLLHYEVLITLCCDGRIDIKPNERVKVTIARQNRTK